MLGARTGAWRVGVILNRDAGPLVCFFPPLPEVFSRAECVGHRFAFRCGGWAHAAVERELGAWVVDHRVTVACARALGAAQALRAFAPRL